MPTYDEELLDAARRLIARRAGQRGRLPVARVRRSISTSYYALFHFILDEVGQRVVGTHNDLRIRRRIISRTVAHAGVKSALDKVRGTMVDPSVAAFLGSPTAANDAVATPRFVRDLARAFLDAQAKRHDADYDMNKKLGEADARLLHSRVRDVVRLWRASQTAAEREASTHSVS